MNGTSLIANILIAFGALQALFISVIFLSQRQIAKAKRLFALFLIIEGITLVERLLGETGLMSSFPHILGVSYPLNFLKPPVLFFTALLIVNNKFKLRKVHAFHLIPFLIILAMNLPFYALEAAAKVQMVETFINFVPSYGSFNFYLFLSFYGYIGVYLFLSIKALKGYREHIKNNRSANWYLNILWIYSAVLFITLVYFVLLPTGFKPVPYFNVTSMLVMTFLIQSIAYSFFTQAGIFANHNPTIVDIEARQREEQLIRDALTEEKIYLDQELNLDKFSTAIGLQKKQVSDLINQRFGCSFNELIGKYRVEEAMSMMKSEDESTHLIEIALESGFNNKVSFYRAFKKHTGKSPSEYLDTMTRST